MEKRLSRTGLPFLLFRPDGEPTAQAAPLIVFLHGSGERGDSRDTLDSLLVHSLPWAAANDRLPPAEDGSPLPFLIACPQTATRWDADAGRVLDLVDELCATEGADPARCYLTGVSLGGGGCWDVATVAPDRFAALVPVSGWARIEHQTADRPPAWHFHGGRDRNVPLRDALEPLVAARRREVFTRLEVDPVAAHDAELWNSVYTRPELYTWLLEQSTA